MQYMGGKFRLAKYIAPIVAEAVPDDGEWWDPFCGGLSMSVALARATGRPGVASDACAPLIALYRAMLDGWDPPTSLSESEYREARHLPDDDPLKAFAGFGCSFGAKYFAGYARCSEGANYAGRARRALRRKIAVLRQEGVAVSCMRFEDRPVSPFRGAIYCDPPYAGTTGYPGAPPFDREAFLSRCVEWARAGAAVFVSEYDIDHPAFREVWSRTYKVSLTAGLNGRAKHRTDRLYRVVPL